MTLGQRTDIEANEHWVRVANGINRFWGEEFGRLQRADPNNTADDNYGPYAEALMVLSEIVADLAQSMAEYHKWRAS